MPNGYVSGSGASNAGYAVVYPDNSDEQIKLASYLHQQNLAQQQRVDQQQQADAAHKFALDKYYGGQFDMSKFDTGTDLNKSINDLLVSGKKNFAQVLNQPGVSDEDVSNAADQNLAPAMKLYQIGSAVKRNIDNEVGGYDKKDGIDTGSLAKQAYINAIYTKDAKTGKLRLKNEDELNQVDPEHNFAADIVNNRPDLVYKGNGVDIEGGFKSMIPQKVSVSGAYYDKSGIKHTDGGETQIYQGAQNIVKDAKGITHVVTVNNPIPVTDDQGNPVIDPKTGKASVINQVPDIVMNHFQKTAGQKAALDVATMKYLQSHPATSNESATPNTPGFEIAKKAMLYDMVDQYGPKIINTKGNVQASGLAMKVMLGVPLTGSGSNSGNQAGETQASFNDVNSDDFKTDNGNSAKIENGQLVNTPGKGTFWNPAPKVSTAGLVTGSMPIEAIPTSLRNAVVKYSQGNDVSGIKAGYKDKPTGRVQVQLTDGKLSGIMTDKGQWFQVNDRSNGDIIQKNKNVTMKQKEQINLGIPTKGGNNYIDTKVINGVKWGKKADGTIEKIN